MICVITIVPILAILEDKDLPQSLSSMPNRYLRMIVLVVYMVRKRENCTSVAYTEEKTKREREKINRHLLTNRPFIFLSCFSIGQKRTRIKEEKKY